jgi:AraC family transcriptional regulator, transcriptional activator of pobA
MKLTEFSLWGSDISLEEHLSIDLSFDKLPIECSPVRMERGVICFFTQGKAEIEVDCVRYQMERGMILSVFPMQIVEQIKISPDLELMYFSCSPEILNRVLFRFPPEFEMFLREYPTFKLPEKTYLQDIDFLCFLQEKMEDRENVCRNEIMMSHLRCFYLEMYNNLQHRLLDGPYVNARRKMLVKSFVGLVMKHYRESREVSFYANKLNITPKYLSIVTKEINGQNAKRIIDEYIVTEIKLLLKSTSKSIQEISEEMNFPDQSFLCKYFKKQSGISPKQYRTANLIKNV